MKSNKTQFLKCLAIEDLKYCENLRVIPTKPTTTEKESNETPNNNTEETKSTTTFKTIITTEMELKINFSAYLRLSHIKSIFCVIFNRF